MAWRDQLRTASFRGATFFYRNASADLGRRQQRHEYPGRDLAWHEDLGRKTREFSIRAYVLGADYMVDRDRLIEAIAALGCFHVWGGEGGEGMFPDHAVYDPRAGEWTRLADMPAPVHGVTGVAFLGGLIHIPGGGLGVGGGSPTTLHQTYRPAMACE